MKLIQTVSLYMKINKRKERRQREYLTQDAECGLLLHQNNTRTVIDFKETSVDIENEMSLKRRVGKMINEVMQIEMDTIDDTWMYGFMHVDHKLKDRKKVYFGKNIEVGLLVDKNNASGATDYTEVSVDTQNMQTLKKQVDKMNKNEVVLIKMDGQDDTLAGAMFGEEGKKTVLTMNEGVYIELKKGKTKYVSKEESAYTLRSQM